MTDENADEDRSRAETARREFLRLLNLAHVLFLSQAGEKEHVVVAARALQRGGRFVARAFGRRVLVGASLRRRRRGGKNEGQQESIDDASGATSAPPPPTPDDSTPDDSLRGGRSIAAHRTPRSCATPETRPRGGSGSGSSSAPVFLDDDILGKHVTHLGVDDCVAMGLVTPDEWDRLTRAQSVGMPRFVVALCWAGELLGDSHAAGWIDGETRASVRGRLNAAASAAGRVLTYLASQLPYTYVHLVSLVVHVYLFTLATWFGFVMRSGLRALRLIVDSDYDAGGRSPSRSKGTSLASDALTLTFGYVFVAFSNVLFQGLLNMHALLDNPFGHHPAKFPSGLRRAAHRDDKRARRGRAQTPGVLTVPRALSRGTINPRRVDGRGGREKIANERGRDDADRTSAGSSRLIDVTRVASLPASPRALRFLVHHFPGLEFSLHLT